jgi:hypothetical protein
MCSAWTTEHLSSQTRTRPCESCSVDVWPAAGMQPARP